MLIDSSRGGTTDPNYVWRERTVNNWPRDKTPDSKAFEDDVVSKAPDSADWISEDHRIIGATQVGTQLWFAWTGAGDDGGYGGFKFPHPHIQIAKFDISKDFERIDQMQVWNGDHAYAYASLTTNSDNEVGISLAWGGGASFFADMRSASSVTSSSGMGRKRCHLAAQLAQRRRHHEFDNAVWRLSTRPLGASRHALLLGVWLHGEEGCRGGRSGGRQVRLLLR